jgi:hypothetical protein
MAPITIFGKPIGGTSPAKSPTGLKNAPGGTSKSGRLQAAPSQQSKVMGRSGSVGPAAANAGSNVYEFNQTITAANTFTYPLTLDGDVIGMNFNVSTIIATASTSADVLAALATVQIIAPDGPIITMQPAPDFYLFSQRFGPYGVAASTVKYTITTTATTYVANYQIPMNLPAAKGPYTIVLTAAAAALATSVTLTSVQVELSLQLGNCNGQRTRYAYTNVPFTPSNSGTNDLAPLAAIQDVDLQELFLTGLATNTSAIAYVQLQSQGSSVAPKFTGQQIVNIAASYLTGSVSADYAYPLLALQSALQLGRSAHAYITWGSTAPSAPRTGFYWFD